MKRFHFLLVCLILSFISSAQVQTSENTLLVEKSKNAEYFPFVKAKALEVMRTGFNAGDGYREVWIRDYFTFIELAAQVYDKEVLKENILVFFRMQGDDGNIIDGFTPAEKVNKNDTDFSYSKLEPHMQVIKIRLKLTRKRHWFRRFTDTYN